MPLIYWLGGLFTALVAWFAKFFGKRLAIVLAMVTGYVGLTIAFALALKLIIVSILVVTPGGQWFLAGLGLLPGNITLCVGAFFAAKVAALVYSWKKEVMKLEAQIAAWM